MWTSTHESLPLDVLLPLFNLNPDDRLPVLEKSLHSFASWSPPVFTSYDPDWSPAPSQNALEDCRAEVGDLSGDLEEDYEVHLERGLKGSSGMSLRIEDIRRNTRRASRAAEMAALQTQVKELNARLDSLEDTTQLRHQSLVSLLLSSETKLHVIEAIESIVETTFQTAQPTSELPAISEFNLHSLLPIFRNAYKKQAYTQKTNSALSHEEHSILSVLTALDGAFGGGFKTFLKIAEQVRSTFLVERPLRTIAAHPRPSATSLESVLIALSTEPTSPLSDPLIRRTTSSLLARHRDSDGDLVFV